ncbi:hypothetical protein [Salinisphaera sp. T31B1]|uniref:hypothetical protein n=1 Tax=Salinisphaera sp. T31B1 TaxID=727963 RepID=UPI003341E414
MSSSFSRTVHGDQRSIDLSDIAQGLGEADAFVGVDALSTRERQYLTSGLEWRSGASDAPLVHVSALQTEGRGDGLGGGQTLVRAENRLDLGSRWFLPDLTTEIAQVSNSGDSQATALGGRAARIGVSQEFGPASLNLGYYQADPSFDALGSNVTAGDRGMELESSYDLGADWRLAHDVRFHQATELRADPALAQTFVLSRAPRLTDVGTPWRVSAQLGAPAVAADAGRRAPMALELGAQTARWRAWRVNNTLGWYDAGLDAPLALPVQGGMWQMSASRGLNIAGLYTEITPSFSLGGSRYDDLGLGTRTGLSLGLSRLSDSIDLNVDYLSAGWSPVQGRDSDLQMTLNFTQSTSAIMPSLRSMASSLRLPWQPRY